MKSSPPAPSGQPCPPGTSAYERAGIFSRISFAWVGPLIKKGWLQLKFEENEARFLVPARDDAPQLSTQFEQSYAKVKVRGCFVGLQHHQQQQWQQLQQLHIQAWAMATSVNCSSACLLATAWLLQLRLCIASTPSSIKHHIHYQQLAIPEACNTTRRLHQPVGYNAPPPPLPANQCRPSVGRGHTTRPATATSRQSPCCACTGQRCCCTPSGC